MKDQGCDRSYLALICTEQGCRDKNNFPVILWCKADSFHTVYFCLCMALNFSIQMWLKRIKYQVSCLSGHNILSNNDNAFVQLRNHLNHCNPNAEQNCVLHHTQTHCKKVCSNIQVLRYIMVQIVKVIISYAFAFLWYWNLLYYCIYVLLYIFQVHNKSHVCQDQGRSSTYAI